VRLTNQSSISLLRRFMEKKEISLEQGWTK